MRPNDRRFFHYRLWPDGFVIAPRLTFERLSVALFFLAVASAACLMPAQSDTWWHLRAGEEIWRLRSVPLRDSFSHTAYGGYWPDHEWLSQALFYGLYQIGGLKLLTAVLAAFMTATWILVWRVTPGSHWRRLLLVCLALVPSSLAWSLRPQVFTLFFLALTVFLLTKGRLWWLPFLFLVWANLHGAVLLGILVMVAAVIGTALTNRCQAYHLLAVALSCVLATTMTPLGLSFWTEMPASIARIDQIRISEWRAPQFADPVLLPFWLLMIGLVVLVALQKPWRNPQTLRNVAVTGALAIVPLALSAARNVPPLMLLAVPAIATLLDASFRVKPSNAVRMQRPALNFAVLVAAVVVTAGSVLYAWSHEIEKLGWHPLPEQAIAAVAACPERLYNRYDEGGYLIWFVPNQRVFLDGRQDPYPPELILEQLRLESSGEYKATFERYNIGCALIPSGSLVARQLTNAGWRTMYHDARWAVFATPSLHEHLGPDLLPRAEVELAIRDGQHHPSIGPVSLINGSRRHAPRGPQVVP